MDRAIVRGKVASAPQFVTNAGKERCHFTMILELERKKVIDATKTEYETVATSVYVATEPELTARCRALLTQGDNVLLFGVFGFHKGKLKMVASGIDLPDFQMVA